MKIMKYILLIFLLSVLHNTFFCQADSFSNKKFEYCIHFGLNETFIGGQNGIIDSYGVTIKDLSVGFTFGGKVKYSINRHIALLTGLTLISFEKTEYKYYGVTYTDGVGKPQIPFILQYYITDRNNNNSWFLSLGALISFEINGSESSRYYPSDIIRPERTVNYTLHSQVNPLLQFGIGKSKISKKNRRTEQILFINKGFKTVSDYQLTRLNPTIKSNFIYRGTTLNYSFRWYFKRKLH